MKKASLMKKETDVRCCDDRTGLDGKYRVESIVTVDDRGQMVLPKEVREKLGIHSGDKLALVVMERGGAPCCITLLKTDALAAMVTKFLGPMTEELVNRR